MKRIELMWSVSFSTYSWFPQNWQVIHLLLGYHHCCRADLKYSTDTKFPKQSNALGQSCGMLHVKSGLTYGSTTTEEGYLLWSTCELCLMFYVSRIFFLSLLSFLFCREYMCSLDVSCLWSFHWWQFNLKHLSCLWGITCFTCFRP